MNKPEKYRKLSITALITGITGLCLIVFFNLLWIRLGLSITAIICGSIDLRMVKRGIYTKKGKGFNIAGIATGGIVILIALIFIIGGIISTGEVHLFFPF